VRQPSRKACAASPNPRKAIEPERIVEFGIESLGASSRRKTDARLITE
jgi:hypothetical protein